MQAAPDDLIVAPATAPGRGALALVRLSGIGSWRLVARLAGRGAWRPRQATRARLALADAVVEEAIVTAFAAPRSFTGQDLVEISVHGSPVIVDALVRSCIEAGARMARPGEFTLRAYLNGRLDLLQAEAVADLVSATTAAQVRVASAHLQGALSERIRGLGDGIAEIRTLLEASLDFPDEGFHFITRQELCARLDALHVACAGLLGSADAGRRLRDGATVVISGPANAGKSSLFNALLRRQRAIVTAVPGTTRDLLTEATEFGGVPVTLVDTAGLRTAEDAVEREGIGRAEAAIASADLVVLVVDPVGTADEREGHAAGLWKSVEGRDAVCVLSKRDTWPGGDMRPSWAPADALAVSVMGEGAGLRELEERLASQLGRSSWEGETLTRARHRSLLHQCREALGRARRLAAEGGSEEFLLIDVHDALQALDGLRGVEGSEQVLESIFSTFCIGK